MSAIPVALNGDVITTPSSLTNYPANPPPPQTATGAWSAGPVVYFDVAFIKVDGIKVIKKAECTFTFSGVVFPPTIPPTPFTATSKVTLEPPGQTKLKDSGDSLLRLGDTNSDTYGNTLTASPTQIKLRSA